jgi:hypothetical protein
MPRATFFGMGLLNNALTFVPIVWGPLPDRERPGFDT